ncbi:MAG TPA: PEGA domain-containing protein [Kofleriaceae bacterium]|jgi:hypothetical protein
MRGAILLVVVAGVSAPTVARADDRARAAEHFALAQSAEKRKDWRAAIAEYEEAYRIAPHPSVLYNIGLDYEHLAAWRDAARYFLRYVDDARDATDRDAVLARLRALREKTSSVTIEVQPTGARVYLDGNQRGRAPIILALAGGRTYEVQAMDQHGSMSSPRRITPEYGESFTLSLDLSGDDDVDDEALAPGNESTDTQVEGGAAGDPTAPSSGLPPGPETPALGGPKLVSTGGAGYHTSDDGTRFTFGLGYRSPGNHVDVGLLTGKFGPMTGLGGELRLYFNAATVRPYVKVGWIYGWYEGERTAFAWEGGGGLLVATSPGAYGALGIDYYLEVIGHRRTVSEDPDLIEVMPEELDATSFALVGGLGVRLGK